MCGSGDAIALEKRRMATNAEVWRQGKTLRKLLREVIGTARVKVPGAKRNVSKKKEDT